MRKNLDSPYDNNIFIKHLQSMDVKSMENYLPDNISYFGTSKTNFLERLKFMFNDYKLGGYKEPKLEIAPNSSDTYYLNFPGFEIKTEIIIEEDNGKLVRVYNNNKYQCKDDAEYFEPYDLIFGDDEAIDFKPTPKYLELLNECNLAYAKLENNKPVFLMSNDIGNWLDNYKTLFSEVDDLYMYFKMNDFRSLYFNLQTIMESLYWHSEVKQALSELETNVISKFDWQNKYNRLVFEELIGFDQMFHNISFKHGIIKYFRTSNIYFTGNDFFDIIKLCKLF